MSCSLFFPRMEIRIVFLSFGCYLWLTADVEDALQERRIKIMLHTVLGKKSVSFTAKDGKEISGTTLYVGYEMKGIEGMATDKVFISAEKMPKGEIVVGSEVDILFNRYGKVEAIRI